MTIGGFLFFNEQTMVKKIWDWHECSLIAYIYHKQTFVAGSIVLAMLNPDTGVSINGGTLW